MTSLFSLILVCLLTSQVLSWEALPNIPSGRRAQFLVLQENGAYKYGYDTGDGNNAAKQEGDPSNEVQGHYFYKNAAGQQLDLKYTSGVGGFQPEGLDKIHDFIKSSAPSSSYTPTAQTYSSPEGGDDSGAYQPDNSGAYTPDDSGAYNPTDDSAQYKPDDSGDYRGDQGLSGDASYNFNVDTPTYRRTEASDAAGNIQGSYSYNNKEGKHDLQYIAGAETGFVARSGSLSIPNGLGNAAARSGEYPNVGYSSPNTAAAPKGPVNPDGSYSFEYSANDQSRQESGDGSGNVRGRYSFRNSAGHHDLSYSAGSETGFLITGGSLSKPNGLPNSAAHSSGTPEPYSASSHSLPSTSFKSSSSDPGDGTYSFGFSTADQDRQENADASGNVRGRFSYRNSAGTHDLSYVAGSNTGFLPTGGSLANPNGLTGSSSAPSGKSDFPGYSDDPSSSEENYSQGDQSDTGDASYNFSFDTPEYTRQESSDTRGNVRGAFTYRNKAGNHDLSFVAGSETGFQPSGGSLNVPPGLSEAQLRSGFRGSGIFSPSTNSFASGKSSYEASGSSHSDSSSETKTSYRLGNVRVNTYLPPSNVKHKFGYIFDTQ